MLAPRFGRLPARRGHDKNRGADPGDRRFGRGLGDLREEPPASAGGLRYELRVSRLAHGGRLEVTPRSDRRGTAYGRDLDVLQIGGDPCCTCLLNLCWASRATFKALVSQSSICVAFTQAASHASSSTKYVRKDIFA